MRCSNQCIKNDKNLLNPHLMLNIINKASFWIIDYHKPYSNVKIIAREIVVIYDKLGRTHR
jgi:hypothetical protein